MSEEINPEMFELLIRLAALELQVEEAEYLRRQLNSQLKVIHELASIPLEDDTCITSHGVPYTPETSPQIRQDINIAYPSPSDIIQQSPDQQDGYIVVPDIPHIDLN